ncbi:HD phosphohydrolase domain-containing protein [Neoconidiobolus thromboides FSU 785]|nr:HD phosphohydrolase domain-containing protein [Neoconidiobolus thromboides FSU 785]
MNKIVNDFDDTQLSNPIHISDPIHGYINLEPYLKDFIDTPQFQRLRNLHQNGNAYMVFPGTSHRRFEHSIGVSHLAGTYIQHLREIQPELDINYYDKKSIKLAGLCHDLGHGPFSHLFDNEFIKRVRPELNWNHEQASNMMLDYLIDDNNIEIEEGQVKYIKQLILGEDPILSNQREKGFLFDIVANKRNSMDVDKFDYIQRDCYNLGMKNSFDLDRLISLSRVIENQICYHQKEVYNIYDMFRTRYNLFKKVCANKTCRSMDMMIVDIFLKAEPTLKLSDKIFNPEEYLYLNDNIIEEIEKSKEEELKESRQIIKRIRKRQLYKFVDQIMIPIQYKDKITKDIITPELISNYQSSSEVSINNEDIIVDWFKLNFGKGEKNPVDYVKFYSRHDLNTGHYIPKDNVSAMVPQQFSEISLTIYSKDDKKVKAIQLAFRKLLKDYNLMPNIVHTIP